MLPIYQIQVIKSDSKSSSRDRRVVRRQLMRHFISNGTDQCQNGSSNLITSYREQPRSIRDVVAYPARPPIAVTTRTNHAPSSFGEQVQVSQSLTSSRKKENCNTKVHGGRGLEPVKLVRDPPSSRQSPEHP